MGAVDPITVSPAVGWIPLPVAHRVPIQVNVAAISHMASASAKGRRRRVRVGWLVVGVLWLLVSGKSVRLDGPKFEFDASAECVFSCLLKVRRWMLKDSELNKTPVGGSVRLYITEEVV